MVPLEVIKFWLHLTVTCDLKKTAYNVKTTVTLWCSFTRYCI